MAAFSAKLEVDGQTYPIVYCDYRFSQATGARGQVREKVRHGLLEVVLDVPRTDQLMVWAAKPHYPLSGHVSFFQLNEFMAHETVSFKDGQCIGYAEAFEAGADGMGSYRCTLTIAAAELTLTAGGPPASVAAVVALASGKGAPALAGGLVSAARRAQSTTRQVQATATRVQQTATAVRWKGGAGPDGMGDTVGKFSGRRFDPDNCGGPIIAAAWQGATITAKGIATVQTHVGRYGDDPENEAMLARLQKIKRGQLAATDWDKRFYTHELREYERYRALGIPDGVDPGREVWNNAHTATLEDFGLSDYDATGRTHNLYHPEI